MYGHTFLITFVKVFKKVDLYLTEILQILWKLMHFSTFYSSMLVITLPFCMFYSVNCVIYICFFFKLSSSSSLLQCTYCVRIVLLNTFAALRWDAGTVRDRFGDMGRLRCKG